MNFKHSILVIGYTGWCGLGCVRGIKSHIYTHNKYNKNEPYMYSNSIVHGFYGIIIYANPALLPFTLHKELYRLETNIRKLEHEKNSKYYNDLFL